MYRFKDPHNYILKMALTAHGTTRKDIFRILGERGLIAMERLMGMLLVMVSVQMLMDGIATFLDRH